MEMATYLLPEKQLLEQQLLQLPFELLLLLLRLQHLLKLLLLPLLQLQPVLQLEPLLMVYLYHGCYSPFL